MEELEIWRPVVGFEGLYEVSNLGRVRNSKRGTILKIANNQKHSVVMLWKNNVQHGKSVAKLVATAFIPESKDWVEVAHKDGDFSNNNVENLCKSSRTAPNVSVLTSNCKRIKNMNSNVIYNSITECADSLGVPYKELSKCLREDKPCRGIYLKFILEV